ncbi:MAG: hypothetical protein LAO07_04820 [Acidobacteriia bacterium]|nr:hypothetical protein [Terriglobia bacterium]
MRKAPKKPYQMTPARLRAARASIRIANAARLARRLPYILTPRRQAAAVANLRKANASPRARGNCFHHGLYCASLRSTIRRAGESLAEFERHLRLFERAFRFPSFLRSEEPRGLIRAAAEVFWRRLRAYRGLARYEAQQLRRVLRRAPEASALTAGRAADLVYALRYVFYAHHPARKPLERVNGRAEDLMEAIVAKRTGKATRFQILRSEQGWLDRLDTKPPALLHNPLLSQRMWAEWQDHNPRGWRRSPRRRAGQRWREKNRGFDVTRPASREECLRQFARVFAVPGDAESAEGARRSAALAWERLKCFHLHARQEAGLVRKVLRRAAARAPLDEEDFPDRAADLLAVFLEDTAALLAAREIEHRLRDELDGLLEKRYGSRNESEPIAAR